MREYGDLAAARRRAGGDRHRAARRTRLARMARVARAGRSLRAPRAPRAARLQPSPFSSRSRSASAPTRRSSASSTRCSSARCRSRSPTGSCTSGRRFESKVDARSEASYPDYLDWRARNQRLLRPRRLPRRRLRVRRRAAADARRRRARRPTSSTCSACTPSSAARSSPGEDAVGAPSVALLTYGFWQRAVRRRLEPSSARRSCSTAPRRRSSACCRRTSSSRARGPPSSGCRSIAAQRDARTQRGNHWLNIVARLKPGVSHASVGRPLGNHARPGARVSAIECGT